ncbi:MAG: DUF3598 family protein [Prochloraceae cyanobacterium]
MSQEEVSQQWANFLKNKGEWHGSFTKFSAEGIELTNVPSILSLEPFSKQKARLTLRRFYPQTDPNKEPIARTLMQEFQPPLAPDLFFFESGSFCRGMMQIEDDSSPTIEFGLINKNRRSRQVQKYNRNGNLEYVTLIREQKYPNTPKGENLPIDALLGTRRGEAIEVDRQMQVKHHKISTQFDRTGDILTRVTIVDGEEYTKTGKIDGSLIDFESEKMLLLEDGAWANFPSPIKSDRAFRFEVGWLFAENSSQRLKRCYNEKGQWISTISIVESKV